MILHNKTVLAKLKMQQKTTPHPSAAKRLFNKTKEVISHIEDNPLLYPLYHDEPLAKRGYRYAVVANYLLFYYIDEAEQTVNVARFLYGGQNVVNII